LSRKLTVILAGILLPAAILAAASSRQQAPEATYPPDHLIRLHIVANSDCAADQELKRKVRDEIIRCVAGEFLEADNIEKARSIARDNLSLIKEIASREVKAAGKDYPVEVELSDFTFPTKHYGPFVLPAGDYESVRVVIGNGGGANWWCVLFPPLCFVDMQKEATISRPDNNSPAPATAGQNFSAAGEQPAGTAAEQYSPAAGEAGSAATPGEAIVKVEFRFRIFDFIKKFIG